MRCESGGLEAGRTAVSMIVGRNPRASRRSRRGPRRDREPGRELLRRRRRARCSGSRSAACPAARCYKAINTADSMIGHRTERYEAFGWAAARLDDLVNLPASRLSRCVDRAAARSRTGASPRDALARGAARRRPPPLAQRRLAGGGDGRRARPARSPARASMARRSSTTPSWATAAREATAADIRRALRLYRPACAIQTRRRWPRRAHRARLSSRSRSTCARQMRGELVERALDLRLVGEVRTPRAEPGQPGGALRVVGEQPVHIGAAHPAVRRDRAVRRGRRRSAAAAARSPGPSVRPTCIS